MQRSQPETVTLNDILITEELSRRSPRTPNLQAENQALHALARQLANQQETMLQTLVDMALELCTAGTAGVSLLETTNGEEIFRWNVLAGTLAHYVGGTTPRNFSLCGVCLERGTPQLFSHPERYFTYFQQANTPVVEGLVLPLIADNNALGTIWIMSHDEQRHFDSEDVRLMTSLADFTAAALLLNQRQTKELLAANVALEAEIRERKRAEAEIRQLGERNRHILESITDAFAALDREWRYTYINDKGAQILGSTPEQLQGRTIWSSLPRHEETPFGQLYLQVAQTKVPGAIEAYFPPFDAWYNVRVYPTENGITIFNLEVTERKRAEAALRESEEKYRSLFESIDEGFCIIEVLFDENERPVDYRFLDINPSFEKQTGIKNAVGKRIREIAPQHEAHWFEIYGRVATTGESIRFENRAEQLNRWYDVYAFRVGEPALAQVGILFNDISDRKRAEAALRESEAKYRSLFNAMGEGFHIIELIDDEAGEVTDYRFLEGNPAFERLTGLKNAAGKLGSEIAPKTESYWIEAYSRVAQTGEPLRIENYSEDTQRWYTAYASRVGGVGSRQIAIIFDDITERKQAEEALRESEEHQTFLLKLSDALRFLANPVEIQEAVTQTAINYFGADRCYYCEIEDDNAIILRDAAREDLPSVAGVYSLSRFAIFKAVVDAGYPFIVSDVYTSDRVDEELRQLCIQLQVISFIDVPVIKNGKPVGIFCLVQSTPRNWTELEIELAQETAERAWAAVNRAHAEESLARSEEKYRSLFNSIDEGFCIIERVAGELIDFRYLEVNPAFAVQTGISDFFGKTLRETFPDAPEVGYEIYENVLKTGEPIRFELEVSSLERILEIYAFRIEGEPRLAVIFKDISDRKRAEKRQAFLLTLADRLRPIADPAKIQIEAMRVLGEHLGVLRAQYYEAEPDDEHLVSAGGYTNGAPPVAHRVRMDDFGVYVKEAFRAGQTLAVANVATDPRVSAAELAAYDALGFRSFVGIPLIKDGRFVVGIGLHHATPRNWTDEELAIAEETADRTWAAVERARAEAALRESEIQRFREQSAREQERQRVEALAELDRAKTLFFSNVSHEFRTPLTLLLAPLQDALSDRAHPLPPAQRERLELAQRNANRLLKLVNTLLDFSRIEAGRIEAVYEPTDLSTFTAELASVFRSAIEQAELRLIVDCLPLPEPVYVDREMWEKIVLNLISNAFKFTQEGEISVRLHPVDRHVVLEIQDTGIGIAPEELPHLFERFYQVRLDKPHAARSHEGSGIGLALVHELVQVLGGTIDVSSTPGQGTCFTIALPFGVEHLPQEQIKASRTLSSTAVGAVPYVQEAELWRSNDRLREMLADTRVLVVDDNADMRDYLTRILSAHVAVEAVADGAAALAAIAQRVPNLVLSDVMMPGLDGFGLLHALRADPRTREIPVILLSARAGEEAIVEGLDAGADDYLIKPFSAQELISRVNAHLQMAQLRSEALHEARSTIRNRDELLSTVSHELNTPLVSILGWTRLLRDSPLSSSMLTKALDTIERNALLQAKLVQDLLDISRISAGKLHLHPQPVELQSVIETAIATVTHTAAAKGIDLVWHNAESLVVMGDRDRLVQVMCNLLTNAIKFTPSGSVTVELSRVDTAYAQIQVVDTGVGITADFLPHVFERFRQAESTSVKGLGLGLAIARHLVELHKGTIHAESAGEGQGATFIVKLPLLATSH
ncbi:ATP-binding protein [Chroococcidiopsis sp. TS-821]|uniref:ATP-binding protein n=1 Tax=Chroococcidiopsis sp. TS-821 TaxID=1378066 RepID=UPI000CEE6C1B|nr:ATP-binding protein [Chroococcidiopsis sp. TS-821]PPS40264.1 hypothetical protein B1A85_20980 [Chroococcidiopsis sp. TS-821]